MSKPKTPEPWPAYDPARENSRQTFPIAFPAAGVPRHLVHPDDMVRAVECVNALAGVPRPEEFVASARELAALMETLVHEDAASIVELQAREPDYTPPAELLRRHLTANRLIARIRRGCQEL